MKTRGTQTTYWLIALFLVLSLLGIAKGCKKDRNPAGPARTQRGLALKLTGDSEIRAKATGITVTAEGLDVHGNLTGDKVEERVSNPIFPLDAPIMLYEPPCRWRITVTVDLMREPPRVASGEIDVCQEAGAELTIETFEEFRVESWAIDAPAEVIAGQAAVVRCEAAINAPDSDRFLPVMTLYEEDGHAVEGPITTTLTLSASFPDPYPSTSLQESRIFTCTIADGCSPDQSFERLVRRILPTPTPTPTLAPGTPTPAPMPGPCTVINNNDSGAGSLRQVLADAPANGCSTITFVAGLPTITLTSGQLTVPAMTVTIDGTGGTVSGGLNSRVFWVNGGTNVTFQNLTIRDGQTGSDGGGIYNNGGTVTIASSSTVSGNTALFSGGGIFNDGGIVTVNGTISGNTANGTIPLEGGGGIYNAAGMVMIDGTVNGNTATTRDGGGIFNSNFGTVTLNGTVSGNMSENGGGIFNRGTFTLNGTVSGNTVNQGGGGILNWGTVNFGIGNLIQGNTAGGVGGGGIYNNGGTFIFPPNPIFGPGNAPNDCTGGGAPWC